MASINLQRRFMVATVVVYLVTGLGAFLALSWLADDIADTLGGGFARRQVQYSRAQCLAPLTRELALARMMASSPVLRAWAMEEDDPDLRRRALAETEAYRRNFAQGDYFFAIHKSGNYYFNDAAGAYTGSEKRYTLNPADPADGWYYATVKSGLEHQLNVNPDQHLKVTKVWINVLMRDDDAVLGVLGTGLDLTSFIRTVVDSGMEGVENIFIDARGAVQAYKDVSRIDFASLTKQPGDHAALHRLIEDAAGRDALTAAMNRIGVGEAVETFTAQIDGRRRLVAIAYIPDIRWYAVTFVDLDQVMRQGRFLWVTILVGVALLVALAATGLVLDRLVLARLRRLDLSVRRFAADGTLPAGGDGARDEIGRLGDSVADMARTVARHAADLERRAQGATDDVAQANRRLAAQAADLEQINAELEQFAYVVSHDLRQPLRMVISYLGLLQRRLEAVIDKDSQQYIAYAVDGGRRMERMIQAVLDFSRTGRDLAPPQPTELESAMDAALRSLGDQIDESGARIHLPDVSLPVVGWRDDLIRLFENLLGNAIKYRHLDRHPEIVVSHRDLGDAWEIEVRDNGLGMHDEDLDRIFQVFQRAATGVGRDGAGVGLSVCRKIVEHHGGRIWVASRLGEGSSFFFTLPKAGPQPPSPPQQQQELGA